MALKLSPIPGSTEFQGPQGQEVTLATKDHIGAVLIVKAEYAGVQLVPAGQAVSTITFPLAPLRNTLKLVFVFSASTTGRGELREVDDATSQFLRDLAGDEPFQIVKITGK